MSSLEINKVDITNSLLKIWSIESLFIENSNIKNSNISQILNSQSINNMSLINFEITNNNLSQIAFEVVSETDKTNISEFWIQLKNIKIKECTTKSSLMKLNFKTKNKDNLFDEKKIG